MALDLDYYKKLNSNFYNQVGAIIRYEELEAIGLNPSNVFCTFHSEHLEMLLKYCHDHPKYHIVTVLSHSKIVNRFVRGDYIYHLASGDKSPDLERIYPPEIVDHMMREIKLIFQTVKPEVGF